MSLHFFKAALKPPTLGAKVIAKLLSHNVFIVGSESSYKVLKESDFKPSSKAEYIKSFNPASIVGNPKLYFLLPLSILDTKSFIKASPVMAPSIF